MDLIRKIVVAEIKEVSGKERTLEFIGSTETQDRVGDIIEAGGWNIKDYKANPVFLWAHRYDQPPIGKANKVWISNDKKLKFHIEFASAETYEFADTIFKLYQGGFLNAVSVGFEPKDWDLIETKDDDTFFSPKRYKKQDLLELSAVPVPANPEALQNATKAGVITTKQMLMITKPEETEDYIRIPVSGEEGKHTEHRIRTIDISKDEGIKALYCGTCKKVITYLFAKDKGWTTEKAKKWVEEHKEKIVCIYDDDSNLLRIIDNDLTKAIEELEETMGAENIANGIDYLKEVIANGEMTKENKEVAIQLANDIYTYFVGGIEAETKIGAVLSVKNRSDLLEAKRRIDAVLEGSEKPEEPEEKPKPEKPKRLFQRLGFRIKEER